MAEEVEFTCPLPEGQLLFRSLVCREVLGQLPEYRLELLHPHADDGSGSAVDPSKVLGKEACVKLKVDNSTTRYFHGLVTEFERGGAVGRADIYRMVLRPWLWQLTLGSDCRIFQDKSADQILDAIFAEYGSASRVDKKTTGSFKTRPYTVQYRESDFNFVMRLMEEEGIYYHFKHEISQHTLVLCNGPSGHDAITGTSAGDVLDWAAKQTGNTQREDVVSEWSRSFSLGSLKYTHTDFAAEAPTTDLTAFAERTTPYPKPNDLEVFNYPGGHDDYAMGTNTGEKKTAGTSSAQLQVNRFESEHCVATGYTPFRGLMIGTTFSFKQHDDAEGYLITSAITQIDYPGNETNSESRQMKYGCRFNAVPKTVAFLPPESVYKALVNGPQTATVVGAAGDEILADKYGRVKIQFHWDRVAKKDKLLEKSSCWVRVSFPWASKQFGMIALPRVGDEVVVEFLEGNPDRPLITGRVYNGDNMPPYELPAQATVSGIKTRSSKSGEATNFNELRFDDKKGSEYVWLQGEKDFHRLVKNDAYDTVQNDLWTEVTQNAQHHVGGNLTLSVDKVATISITGDTHTKLAADLNLAVTGALNLEVSDAVAIKGDKAVALTAGAGMDINASAALNATAGATLHLKAGSGIVIDGGTQLCIKAGGAFILLGPEGVTIQGTMVKINSGGSAGSANDAAKASPAAPKAPGDPKKNTDPLAS